MESSKSFKFVVFCSAIGVLIFQSFVLSKIWGWHFVQFGLPEITLWHALGIDSFFTILHGVGKKIDETTEEGFERMIRVFVVTSSVLLIGFLASFGV